MFTATAAVSGPYRPLLANPPTQLLADYGEAATKFEKYQVKKCKLCHVLFMILFDSIAYSDSVYLIWGLGLWLVRTAVSTLESRARSATAAAASVGVCTHLAIRFGAYQNSLNRHAVAVAHSAPTSVLRLQLLMHTNRVFVHTAAWVP